MLTKKLYLITSCLFAIAGLFVFLFINEYVIFRSPQRKIGSGSFFKVDVSGGRSRSVSICYPSRDMQGSKSESCNIIWSQDSSNNLKEIIRNWLLFVHDEQVISKRVVIESILLIEASGEVYLSFDSSFFLSSWSIYKKLVLVESILKNIRDQNLGVSLVRFLIKNRPMQDEHLDFSRAWPIEGFLSS